MFARILPRITEQVRHLFIRILASVNTFPETGIQTTRYKHLKYFDGDSEVYYDNYRDELVVGTCDIGVESFTDMAQETLVEYIRYSMVTCHPSG